MHAARNAIDLCIVPISNTYYKVVVSVSSYSNTLIIESSAASLMFQTVKEALTVFDIYLVGKKIDF